MPKIKVVLNKTNTLKLNKFFKNAKKEWKDLIPEEFEANFTELVKREIRSLRDCSEKSIVETYIEVASSMLESNNGNIIPQFKKLTEKVRAKLAAKYTSNNTFDNNIDIYFNEVKREYILHPQNECDDLEVLPENRDTFIKNNLKLVINCAKRYQNLGLPFEDLIQVGNEGLLKAFEKFKSDKANLRNKIINDLHSTGLAKFSYDEASDIVRRNFTYDKLLDKTLSKLPKEGFETVFEFEDWVKANVKTAVFASVAFQWIRAQIIIELTNLGCIVKSPKQSKKHKETDEEIDDEYIREIEEQRETSLPKIVRLDSLNPYTDDCYHDNDISEIANEEFIIEDQAIENIERQQTFKQIIDQVLEGFSALDRRIIKKRYGIGYPFAMSINEIAENENISVNTVKYAIKSGLAKIASSMSDSKKQLIMDMLS